MNPAPREKIPVPTDRIVRTRAGHRCSACGEAEPHEIAHIVPHAKTRNDSADNLLLLCTNCHTRADKTPAKWGPVTLRWYRDNPWVNRRGQPGLQPPPDVTPPPFHNLPYPRLGTGFIGREDELEALRAAVQSGNGQAGIAPEPKIAATHGLGGIGKTRLACEYAHRHLWDHDAALFVGASSPDRLRDSIGGLTGLLGDRVPLPADADEEQRRAAVLGWLRQHPAALLILDNIDSEDAACAVKDLLTDPPCRHIILTGRLATWFEGVTPLPLGILSPEKSVAFLLARATGRVATPRDAEHALRIAEKLDGLCLPLEQAATYINYRKIPLTRYLRDWEEKHEECLEWWDEYQSRVEGGPRPYGKSVITTWRTNVDLLTPDARFLLHLCAWLAPAPIPDWIVTHVSALELSVAYLDPDNPNWETPFPSDFLLGQSSIGGLCGTGLATRLCLQPDADDPEPAFLIHRIVQDVTRLSQPVTVGPHPRVPLVGAAAIWMEDLFSEEQEDSAGVIRLDHLVPHALAAAAHLASSAAARDFKFGLLDSRHWLAQFYSRLAEWAHRRGGGDMKAGRGRARGREVGEPQRA